MSGRLYRAPEAITTTRACTTRPSTRMRRGPSPPHSRRETSNGMAISAPNFCAWVKARAASATPEMPAGKPK